jgi:imidazole glycerol-phosphate synthase subunit HisH
MITIVDYGMGNLGSVANMFKRVGAQSEITADLDRIAKAKKILLPGVGAFDAAMQRLNEGGFREVLDQKALREKVPTMGICLGMQLLTKSSDEGVLTGLGWVNAKTIKFNFLKEQTLKVPHIGWNPTWAVANTPLTRDLPTDSRFYFVHSYYVVPENEQDAMLKTHYGFDFCSGVYNHDNIFGAQFHPEKSHKFGMKLFENFAKI